MENVLVLGHGWSEGVTTPEANDSNRWRARSAKNFHPHRAFDAKVATGFELRNLWGHNTLYQWRQWICQSSLTHQPMAKVQNARSQASMLAGQWIALDGSA
jgi:hypothetical protein